MRLEELGKYIKEISHRNKKLEIQDVFSVTNSEGFMLSTDYFSKEVFSKDISNYKIVSQNQFAYNPSRINVGSIDFLKQDSKVIISPLYVVFECNSNLNESYLKYFLKSPVGNLRIRNKTKGAVRETLSFKSLSQIRVPIFPLETQLHIANILSKAESLIAQRKESIRLLDEYLKSVFLEMFGDPVRNEKDWEKHPFSELVAPDCPLTYGIVQPGNDFENGIPVIRPVDLTETFVTRKGLKLIDPKISEQFKRTILKGGELLMCVRGTTGVVSIATKEVAGCNVTRGITPIWFSDNYDSLFAYSLFKTQAINNRIQELTYGATLKQINLGDLRKIELINPPLVLQTKFAQIAEKTEVLKTQYQESLKELENLYGSLSQKAFKGELSIKDEGLLMAAEPEGKYNVK